jgi:F420-dependent oxidoreductase-like protein
MKIGYHFGYWSDGPPPGAEEAIMLAEHLGFDSFWSAESYGSDCLTPLAWWGSGTSSIRLGTNILQMAARTPAATAMAAVTLDHLSGGRFVLGLGASGPQVVEGWYGQSYPKPLARTREYVQIVRDVLARESAVEYDGEFFQLPYPGGTGLGKPLKSTVHPLRSDLPVYLAAEGPKNVSLAAEIADGWLPLFFSPKIDPFYREALARGFSRPGARRSAEDFEVAASVPVIVQDDVEDAADKVRPTIALYVGGMGAKGVNFHYEVFARMGYEAACANIQEHYMAGRKDDAIAAVPTEMVEEISLIGPAAKIRNELSAWEETVVTTVLAQTGSQGLRVIMEAFS